MPTMSPLSLSHLRQQQLGQKPLPNNLSALADYCPQASRPRPFEGWQQDGILRWSGGGTPRSTDCAPAEEATGDEDQRPYRGPSRRGDHRRSAEADGDDMGDTRAAEVVANSY